MASFGVKLITSPVGIVPPKSVVYDFENSFARSGIFSVVAESGIWDAYDVLKDKHKWYMRFEQTYHVKEGMFIAYVSNKTYNIPTVCDVMGRDGDDTLYWLTSDIIRAIDQNYWLFNDPLAMQPSDNCDADDDDHMITIPLSTRPVTHTNLLRCKTTNIPNMRVTLFEGIQDLGGCILSRSRDHISMDTINLASAASPLFPNLEILIRQLQAAKKQGSTLTQQIRNILKPKRSLK